MPHSYVQLPSDGLGKKLDATQTVVNSVTVHRERSASVGATNIAYGGVTVGTTASQIVAERKGRRTISLYNNSTGTIYVGGDASVTSSTGMPIPPNAERVIATEAAIYAIGTATNLDLRYLEEYEG